MLLSGREVMTVITANGAFVKVVVIIAHRRMFVHVQAGFQGRFLTRDYRLVFRFVAVIGMAYCAHLFRFSLCCVKSSSGTTTPLIFIYSNKQHRIVTSDLSLEYRGLQVKKKSKFRE